MRWAQQPDGTVSVMKIDGLGRVVSTIQNFNDGQFTAADPADQDLITETFYDRAGRRLRMKDAAARLTDYSYDLQNRLKSVKENVDASCNVNATDCNILTQYRYDRAGNARRLSIQEGVNVALRTMQQISQRKRSTPITMS